MTADSLIHHSTPTGRLGPMIRRTTWLSLTLIVAAHVSARGEDQARTIPVPETIRAEGYVFQIEVTYRALLAGFKVTEVPIVFRDRSVGSSKMSTRIAAEAMWAVPFLRRRDAAAMARSVSGSV